MALEQISANPTEIMALMTGFSILFFLISIGLYIYTALALIAIAKKTKTDKEWMAWIPILNLVLMARIAKMSWKPIYYFVASIFLWGISFILAVLQNELAAVFVLITFLFMIIFGIFVFIWNWKIFERVSRPGYWSIIPAIFGIITLFFTFIGMVMGSNFLFMVGFILLILGTTLLQATFIGIAAWHKDSIHKKIKKN